LCATDQPRLVRTDTRSLLHCSSTCLRSDQCLNFNYKDTVRICEHFSGYPIKFTVEPNCRHYTVCVFYCYYLPHSYSILHRQIRPIKPVCVCLCLCQCVYPSLCTLTVAFLYRFSQKLAQT